MLKEELRFHFPLHLTVTSYQSVSLRKTQLLVIHLYVPAPKLADWTEWGDCSKKCGSGESIRRRFCLYPDGRPAPPELCDGKNREVRDCNTQNCTALSKF